MPLILFAALVNDVSVTSANGPDRLHSFLERTESPISLGINAAQITGDSDHLRRIESCGGQFVRHSAHWSAIERRVGEFDFSKHRKFYDAAKARGVGIIFILAYNNPLYEPSGDRRIVTDAGRRVFASFAAAAADHFRGENVIWEIWNEPNTRNFWGGKPNSEQCAREYAQLVRATVPAMRVADPHCVIIGGSVSNLWNPSYEWIRYACENGILENDLDGWSVHPYGLNSPEDGIAAYDTVKKILSEFQGDSRKLPILNTECGYSLNEIAESIGSLREEQEEHQANMLVRQYLVDQMCDVKLTIWYAWQDEEFGMLDGRRERSACAACRVLAEQLAGYTFEKRIDLDSPNDFAAVFHKDGRRRIAVWTAGTPHDVHLDVRASVKSIDTVGIIGNRSTLPITDRGLRISVTGSPRYFDLGDEFVLANSSPQPIVAGKAE